MRRRGDEAIRERALVPSCLGDLVPMIISQE